MQPLVANSGGLSFLIYLVIGIFWVFAKMAEQKKAKAKVEEMKRRRAEREAEERRTGKTPSAPPPPPIPSAPRTLDRELEDFLGRLAGEPPRPSPVSSPPLRPVIVFDKAPAAAPPPRPKAAAPAPKPPPPLPVVSSVMLSEEAIAFKPMDDIRDAEEVMHKGGLSEQTSLLSVRTLMVDMSRTSPRIPTIGTASMRSISTRSSKPNLRKPATLRKAIIANLLLEPPKALM
jgi:hypothetical protein